MVDVVVLGLSAVITSESAVKHGKLVLFGLSSGLLAKLAEPVDLGGEGAREKKG